ncbi:hypothetical protein C8R43DRAFT_942431 [Mycena crocata]|nr:hypothetical protein C8R43DRAFT_942431 [Mycena crocata]
MSCRCLVHGPNSGICRASLCRRAGCMGHTLELCLQNLPPSRLFQQCVTSPGGYRVISEYLKFHHRRDEWDENFVPNERTGTLCNVPLNVLAVILLRLELRDRVRFGGTCRIHRALAKRLLLTVAAYAIKPYGLSMNDVQIIQSCTKTVVSGSVLSRMLYSGGGRGGHGQPSLDFYCAAHEALTVATYLNHATGRRIDPYAGDSVAMEAVWDAYTLAREDEPDINVFEAWSECPLDAVLQLPTTVDLNIWTLDQIWVGYPASTFCGFGMTSPARLPLDCLESRQAAWDSLHGSMADGYWIDSELLHFHECTRDPACPATWRDTHDSGCSTIRFPVMGDQGWRSEMGMLRNASVRPA